MGVLRLLGLTWRGFEEHTLWSSEQERKANLDYEEVLEAPSKEAFEARRGELPSMLFLVMKRWTWEGQTERVEDELSVGDKEVARVW